MTAMTHRPIYGINALGDPTVTPVTDQLRMMAQVGFGAFFTAWDPAKTEVIVHNDSSFVSFSLLYR